MKLLSFIAGLSIVILLGYFFMGEQTKSRIDQAGRVIVEQGKELGDKLKSEAPSAAKTLPETPSGTSDEIGKKVEVDSDISDISLKPKEQKEVASTKKMLGSPEEIGSDEEELEPPVQAKETPPNDLEEAQSILMEAGKFVNR